VLHIELILYAARARENRPELARRLRDRRAVIAEIISATNDASGPEGFVDPSWASMLLAVEDGYRLHRLIDPLTTPEDSFLRAIQTLQELVGLGRPASG
jgi:hypothetical protein